MLEPPSSARSPSSPPPVERPPLITRWDLDKTYLRSEFYSLMDLLASAVERPDQKRAVPGASTLLRQLGRLGARVHVLSGSPRQMRGALLERLALDGVLVDELTLKPNLSNIVRLRFRAIKDQLGYKLPALLETRARELHLLGLRGTEEVLFGDDSEADAFVYSLYADICRGRVDTESLARVLEAGDVYPDVAERCLAACRSVQTTDLRRVRILIHLDRQTPPSRFASYGKDLVPFHNYAQAALVLLDDGIIPVSSTFAVARELVDQHRFDVHSLARSYIDLERRGHMTGRALELLLETSSENTPAPLGTWAPTILSERNSSDLPVPPRFPGAAPPDYVALAREHRGGKNRR